MFCCLHKQSVIRLPGLSVQFSGLWLIYSNAIRPGRSNSANFDHGGTGFGEFNYAGEACEKVRKPSYFAVFLFSGSYTRTAWKTVYAAAWKCAIISAKSTPISKRIFALDALVQCQQHTYLVALKRDRKTVKKRYYVAHV